MEARNKENGTEETVLGKVDRKKEIVKIEQQVEVEADDMISAVKSRRLLSMQAKRKREIQERETKGKICPERFRKALSWVEEQKVLE